MDYFRPIQRKIGIMILLVACIFAAIWVRSLGVSDSVFYPTDSRLPPRFDDVDMRETFGNDMTIGVWSCNGCLVVEHALDAVVSETMFDFGEPWSLHRLGFGHPGIAQIASSEGEWIWKAWGFGKLESRDSLMATTVWIFPYWSVILPLTLLSAVLLVSRPRTTKVRSVQ